MRTDMRCRDGESARIIGSGPRARRCPCYHRRAVEKPPSPEPAKPPRDPAARLRGLYALTPSPVPDDLPAAVAAALDGGARLLQYRDKHAGPAERRARAEALLRLCRRRGAPLLINDDLELALAIGADGVHLGAADAPVAEARARLPDGLVGASCYDDLERARAAARAGASYVAFGSFHPSPTKPGAARADPGLLAQARRELSVPVCAIGGIHAGNAPPLLAAGAELLAVCDGVFGRPDIAAAAAQLARLCARHD